MGDKRVYTKEELIEMGFGFDLNGNIVTPAEEKEHLKKYLKYKKDKWLERACKYWDYKNTSCMYEIEMILGSKFIEDFKKHMSNE